MGTRTDGPEKAAKKDPRVALLSTTRTVFAPMEAAFQREFPEATLVHILDETLLDDFRQAGGLSPRSRRKALQMALNAEDAGVDAILFTCSTLSPVVEDFKPFITIPALRIDEPTVELVLQLAEEIGLLSIAESVLNSYEPFVLEKALRMGRKITVHRFVKNDLGPLRAKNLQAFYHAVGETATEAAKACQAVILCQASMAPGWDHVERSVQGKVYAMPAFAVRALRHLMESR